MSFKNMIFQLTTIANKYSSRNIQNMKKSLSLRCQSLNYQPKKINIKKFLSRLKSYDNKKNYNLEQIKIKSLLLENDLYKKKKNKSRGKKSIFNNNDPFYLRTLDTIHKKQDKYKKIEKSKDTSRVNSCDYSRQSRNTKRKLRKALSSNEINNFYKSQENWKKNINKKINSKSKIIQAEKEKKLNLSNSVNFKSRNFNKKSNTIYDDYIQNQFNNNVKKAFLTKIDSIKFKPSINNNMKYKNITPKYTKNVNNRTKVQNKNQAQIEWDLIEKYKQKFLDIQQSRMKKIYNKNLQNLNPNINPTKNTKKTKILLKWEKRLNKINNNKIYNDKTYHLNIQQTTPWNKNVINKIKYNKSIDNLIY